jgi:tetratricopeptide (TPR) repeat protein
VSGRLEQLLTAGGRSGPVVGAVHGPGGVGKSALALHAAHRVAGRFGDGQVYVNLQGATPGLAPLAPLEVLGRMLRSLGLDPALVPTGLEEAAVRFRSLVAGRRLLVVLDNARDAAQVRPLLPASPGCAVLITSRQQLTSLDSAIHLPLEVLVPQEAAALLGRVAGAGRIAAEPEAAAEVVNSCGRLPLAIQIAGARLASRPAWPVARLASRLADTTSRLDELATGDLAVRATFQVSLHTLQHSPDPRDQAAAAAFGLLGLPDGPDLEVAAAASLLDQPHQATQRLLERLVDARLLASPTPGRYRMHDLVRLFAREQAAQQHPQPDRLAALTRLLGCYTATAWHTLGLLRPGDYRLATADPQWTKGGLEFPDDQLALAWLEAERANLLAAIRQAADTPAVPSEIAVQLTHALFPFFLVRGHWQDSVQATRIALRVARQMGDLAAQAQGYNNLGGTQMSLGQYQEALAHHRKSLAIRRELGDCHGQGASLSNLGIIHERQGRYEEALACQQQSLTILRELGDRRGQAASLGNLGVVYQRLGRHQEALACQQESLAIFLELGDRLGQGESLNDLGVVYQRHGQYDQALACHQESLVIRRELGDRHGEAYSLTSLGQVHGQLGRYDEAITSLEESLAIFRDLGDPLGQAEAQRDLGDVLRALGRQPEARATWQEALETCKDLRVPEADELRARLAALLVETPPPANDRATPWRLQGLFTR